MDEKGKVLEPVLKKEEFGHAYRETEPEWQDERARYYTVSVNEVKS